jgi:DNA-directed RNA polymerase specialized sigma subunit
VNPEMRDPRPDFSERVIAAMSVKKLLKNAKLTEKEYLVVCLWSQDYNMVSLAEKFRVHQSRISQINKNAIKKIRRVVFP